MATKVEEPGITIKDFTKQYLNETVETKNDVPLILPNFPTPIPKGGVGGKLQKQILNWEQITNDQYALNVIRHGYMPQFKEKPPLVRNPPPIEYDLSDEQKVALDNEVENFLENDVIEEVKDLNSPGFYSCLFVRPRSNDSPDKWRCIFDISQLNKYLIAPKFRMESAKTIRNLLKLDNYCVKLDLSDAFLHVPLHKAFRRFMRFFHRGKVYQFKTICFGANFSPYIFSYLINVTMKFFHKLNIDIAAYLDDMLGQHPVSSTMHYQILYVVQVLQYLGWTVNLRKSILDPVQVMVYIGLEIDFTLGLVFPPQERWQKIQNLAKYFLSITTAAAKLWCSLLGLLTSCQDLTFMGRLWLRPLQVHLNHHWKNRKNLFTSIPVTPECKQAISWWTKPLNVMQGVPWTYPPPEVTLYTDSSDYGWGGHLENQKIAGQWDLETQKLHINVKEMMAIWETMKYFQNQIMHKSVMVATDNTSCVAYLNKLGGTKSAKLQELTVQILSWCQDRGITLRARHIPGKYNVISDQLSRQGQIISTEWSIHPSVIQAIKTTWEMPMIDLFATRYNNKLPTYFSPIPDQLAMGVDAMSQSWEGMIAYAYPPQAILMKVLQKIRQEKCTVYLIAPAWSSRSWYPTLLSLLIDLPRKITIRPKLLKQPLSNVYHTNPDWLNLHVWKLSNDVYKQKVFLQEQPRASQRDVDNLLINYMRQSGEYTHVGVIKTKLIRSKLLRNK